MILLQLSYNGDRYDTVLVALAISALAIPHDGDRYDTVLAALIVHDGDRYDGSVVLAIAFAAAIEYHMREIDHNTTFTI